MVVHARVDAAEVLDVLLLQAHLTDERILLLASCELLTELIDSLLVVSYAIVLWSSHFFHLHVAGEAGTAHRSLPRQDVSGQNGRVHRFRLD